MYRTRCDTETVLHLHAREGLRGVERLRGMFAIALWDRQSRELCLIRDRFGVKPLYYVHTPDGALYFASEIKALIESGAVRPELNRRALPDFLANHATSGDETLFHGVRRLPPGHTLRWRDGRIEIARYWDLTMANRRARRPLRSRAGRRVPRAAHRGGAAPADERRAARACSSRVASIRPPSPR